MLLPSTLTTSFSGFSQFALSAGLYPAGTVIRLSQIGIERTRKFSGWSLGLISLIEILRSLRRSTSRPSGRSETYPLTGRTVKSRLARLSLTYFFFSSSSLGGVLSMWISSRLSSPTSRARASVVWLQMSA